MRHLWRLITGACTGCGICFDVCPHLAIRMDRESTYPEPVADGCTGCLICVQECPFDAIELEEALLAV